ncbi:hypothetical protein [Kocuria atrinae]|uniref:hypothetical protein n=1 Tax=Kocuria atrinae TaxID=592377 RepID=UPI0002F7AAB4|nr:hypothetical protein [Kocuria atrinae]
MNKKLRLLVATSLILFAALSIIWTMLLPDHFDDPFDSLLAIADAGVSARSPFWRWPSASWPA